ncbi:MAG: peptidoglycan DD-metalloendopeptidase family protein [Eubacterium sp.]|nr:peptidoglycan DD-metalloendopeptidase family protein [Eubacterium sp.]
MGKVMKKSLSIILTLGMILVLIPNMGKVKEVEAASCSRSDGIWLFPLASSYYNSFTDWAGCPSCSQVAKKCPVCGETHPSNWGTNRSYNDPYGHNGIDVGATSGTVIKASAPGKLYSFSEYNSGRGNTIIIEHKITGTNYSYYSYYQHLSSFSVTSGNVNAGQTIGKVGNTGDSRGAHLHFGIVLGYSNNASLSYITSCEKKGWIMTSGYKEGRILNNPAQSSDAGFPVGIAEVVPPLKAHYGSINYTFDVSKVSINAKDETGPSITNVKATTDSTGATIECDITDESGVSYVQFPTWPSTTTSAGCEWSAPTSVNGNHYTFRMNISKFNNWIGKYFTHIYAYDNAGQHSAVEVSYNAGTNRPVGYIDSIESKGQGEVTVAGWAYDADNTSMSIPVHVYVNGPCGSAAEGFALTADKSRPDVNEAKGITGNHGYNDTIYLKSQTTGKVSLYFYAINDDGTNAFTFLGSREVTLSSHKHNYVLETNTLPTCTKNGKQIQKCSCGSTIETVIKALGHNEVIDNAIEPTETANGMTEGKHCTVCGEITQKPEILPMKGQDSIEKTDESITGKLGNHEYVVCNGSFSALEAASKQTSGYHLATITSLDEHNFIMGLIDQLDVKSTGYWLGASDEEEEGVFKWYTGEVFSYNRWPVGQPDNKDADDGGPENYLGIWSFGVWNDWTEKTKLGYVLEKDEYSECEHKWNEGEVTTEPSCTEEGIKTYTCSECSETYTETIPAKGHVQEIIPEIQPTCNDTGYTAGVRCSVCKEVVVEPQEIESLGHDFSGYLSNNDATCIKDGTETATCPRCGATDTRVVEGSSTDNHDWSEYEETQSPTCQVEGIMTKHCKVCEKESTVTLPIIDHDYVPSVIMEATCTEDGKIKYTCSMCNDEKTEIEDCLGHYFGEYISNNDATCIKNGTATAKCYRCDATDTIEVEGSATGVHEWGEYEVTQAPTCTSVGVKTRYCKYCKKKSSVGIPTLKHEYIESIQKEATCTETGIRKLTCKLCEDEKFESIECKAHTLVIDPAVEPTTEKTGLTEGSHCSVCNAIIKKQEIVPKKEASNSKSDDNKKEEPAKTNYSNEWINGKWYNADGTQTYKGTLQWKSNSTGWWVEDTDGWYPTNSWQKIDGIWYYFKPDGYMAANEYYKGYWFNSNGSWDDKYQLSWKSNSTGWWVEDKSGWWPSSNWLKIDGYWYYFDASGYMVTSQYVDGYWIGADGVCY